MPASPPVNAILASGNLRESATASNIRSPASFKAGAFRRLPDQPILGTAEHDETGRRGRRVEIGSREAILKRQDQRIAERRKPYDQAAAARRR